jgi:AraC-like DNA-binding protein
MAGDDPQRATAIAPPTGPRGVWIGDDAALFNHKCDRPEPRGTEYYVSAPCIVLSETGAFQTSSALGDAMGDPAMAVFRNTLAPYTVRDVPGPPSQVLTIRLSPSVVRSMLADVDPAAADSATFSVASAPVPGRTALLHALVRRELARDDPLGIEESVLRLSATVIARLGDRRTRTAVTPKAREHVAAARDLLVRRACEPLRLRDVAARAGCSPWHLARAFHAVVGTTIGRHITRLRLRSALERVLDTDEGLTKIAIESGFADHSHFTSAFRREYGATPSQVRARTARSHGLVETAR